jgi:S1-C subfamily serine protease
MAKLARTRALSTLAVLLCTAAVHCAEVEEMVVSGVTELSEVDSPPEVQHPFFATEGGGPPKSPEMKRDTAKKFTLNREAYFRGKVDDDESGLDNGDDSDLKERGLALAQTEEHGDLGESQGVGAAASTQEKVLSYSSGSASSGSASSSFASSESIPALPTISETDEKYLPAIMDKLVNMRNEMATLKGANWEEILEEHRDGVVQIMVVKKKYMWKAAYRAPLSEQISGSGWFINNNEFDIPTAPDMLVITNAHVAKNAAEINLLIPSLGQEPIPAEVVGLCSQRDIAILKVTNPDKLLELYKTTTGKSDIIRMKLGDSDEMKRGARVMAVGYPLGMKSVKASMGIVSGYQQFKSALYLQITAPINPGNSGGPLFNDKGQVVGINSAKIASASGMSFSISSVQLKVMLDVLYQRRQFIVPYLGYGFSVGTKLIQQYLEVDSDLNKAGGVYITKVEPNGLFKEAGVEPGDLLVTVDGANIDRFGQTWMPTMKDNINILGLLARKAVGADLSLGVWRKSSQEMLTLTAMYDETPPFAVPYIYEPILHKPKYEIFAGIVFMELVENLVETLLDSNVAELIKYMEPANRASPAVIIAGVLPGSLADLDGSVKEGMILQKFNGAAVTTIDELCQAKASANNEWYTISTSKTFTALKQADIEADVDPEMAGRTGYCELAALAANATKVLA